jgi:hypothetical protein
MGNGAWGMGHWAWGIGNRKQEMGKKGVRGVGSFFKNKIGILYYQIVFPKVSGKTVLIVHGW